jgi:hypothetical protein
VLMFACRRNVASVAISPWFFARKHVVKLCLKVCGVTVNLILARRAASDTIRCTSWDRVRDGFD